MSFHNKTAVNWAGTEAESMLRIIRSEIERREMRAIPFRDYMELCLYHPTFGYYCRDTIKVGKEGDFYTSASIGTIMGEVAGRFFARLLSGPEAEGGAVAISEWGGGSGRMAGQILDAIAERSPDVYDRLRYVMVEISPFHRMLQQEELKRHPNVLHMTPDEWLNNVPACNRIVFSNELLDAFPVHRITKRNGIGYEVYVEWDDGAERLRERLVPLSEEHPAAAYMKREGIVLKEGQLAEINIQAVEWVRAVCQAMRQGTLVTVDYGDIAEELYAAHRMNGTLMCYRKHQAFDDPYRFPGEQDMTSHVDFSAIVRAGTEIGFSESSLRTQKQFLIDEGVMELLCEHDGRDPFSPAARRNRAIRQLLISDQMSELFKVLVQTKKR